MLRAAKKAANTTKKTEGKQMKTDLETINMLFSEVLMNLPLEKEVIRNGMQTIYRRR